MPTPQEIQIKDKYFSTGPWEGYRRSSINLLSEEYGKTRDEIRRIIKLALRPPVMINGINVPLDLEMLDHLSFGPINALPENIGDLKALTAIRLPLLTVIPYYTALPNTFDKLTNLKVLNLEAHRLVALPETFGNLAKLESLNLSGNRLTELPASFQKLRHLFILKLDGNRLTVNGLTGAFTGLKQLTELYLEDNGLTGLPEDIMHLKKLTSLELERNLLTEVPNCVTTLTNLTDLRLDQNNLTVLPENFGKLIKLTHLMVNHNRLESLPDSIVKLTHLKRFDVSENRLTVLPANIGKMTGLTHLNLARNLLTALPKSIGKLVELTRMDLRSNRLTSLPDSASLLVNCEFNLFGNTAGNIIVSSELYARFRGHPYVKERPSEPVKPVKPVKPLFDVQQLQQSMRKEMSKVYKDKAVKYARNIKLQPGQQDQPIPFEGVPPKLKRAYRIARGLRLTRTDPLAIIPLRDNNVTEYDLTSVESESGSFCFRLLVDEIKKKHNYALFTNIIEIHIIDTPAIDRGGPQRQVFAKIGEYMKTLLVYEKDDDNEEGIYKFKYNTPAAVISDIAIMLTIAFFQNLSLDITLSPGILHLFVCGISRVNIATSLNSEYLGTLMYLLNLTLPGDAAGGTGNGTDKLLQYIAARQLDFQPVVAEDELLKNNDDVLMYAFKRQAERLVFYGDGVWYSTQQGRVVRKGEVIEDIHLSEKLYMLWTAFNQGIERCNIHRGLSNVSLSQIRDRFGVVLTREIMLRIPVSFSPYGVRTPEIAAKFRGFYEYFIENTEKPEWTKFLKFLGGNASPHLLEFNVNNNVRGSLPFAHTCSWTIDIENYSIPEQFTAKMLQAIEETSWSHA
jgi:hypothetical protein